MFISYSKTRCTAGNYTKNWKMYIHVTKNNNSGFIKCKSSWYVYEFTVISCFDNCVLFTLPSFSKKNSLLSYSIIWNFLHIESHQETPLQNRKPLYREGIQHYSASQTPLSSNIILLSSIFIIILSIMLNHIRGTLLFPKSCYSANTVPASCNNNTQICSTRWKW